MRGVPAWVLRRIQRIASTINMDVTNVRIKFQNIPDKIGSAGLVTEEIGLDFSFFEPSMIDALEFTLLHELRHLQQARRGLLKCSYNGVIWQETFHQIETGELYYLSPWENDANTFAMYMMRDDQLTNIPVFRKILAAHERHNVKFEMIF